MTFFRLTFLLLITSGFLIFGCTPKEYQQPVADYTILNPADAGSRYPNLYKDEDGTVTLSWLLAVGDDFHAVRYTTFVDGWWTEPKSVVNRQDFFVNWADFPSVVSYDGAPYAAHWLRKIEGGTYAYNVQIAFRNTDGRWPNMITPHDDETPTEHGFVSLLPLDQDKVLAVWLDGRHTEHRDHDEYGDMGMAMTLRSAEVYRDGSIGRERVIDQAVCDCCQTDLIRVGDTAMVVYRNRTENEVRDISVARYDLNTGRWGEPFAVWDDGWEIGACPVNGPRIAAYGDDVAVTWFTGAGDENKVMMARSDDGGLTFYEPVRVDEGNAVGRTDILMTETGDTWISWMETPRQFGSIYLRKFSSDGGMGEPILVGNTDPSRRSGFPRMAMTDSGILMAWTQTDPVFRVRTALYKPQ